LIKQLALLAFLVFPFSAFASNIEFDTGNFLNGSISSSFTSTFNITVMGTADTMNLSTADLATGKPCFSGDTCYAFHSAIVTVESTSGSTLFTSAIDTGAVIVKGDDAFVVGFFPRGKNGTPVGLTSFTIIFKGDTITNGNAAVVSTSVIPEPATFSLLGGGLLLLAGLRRILE
jgi:hypothetical protein